VLAAWAGRDPVRIVAEHEVYLTDPSVLTDLISRCDRAGESRS
jgi:hypothetical protein